MMMMMIMMMQSDLRWCELPTARISAEKNLVYQSELNFNSIVCNKTNFAIKTIEIEKIAPMKNDL